MDLRFSVGLADRQILSEYDHRPDVSK